MDTEIKSKVATTTTPIPPIDQLLAATFGVKPDILKTLLNKKGQFASITYRRPLKLLKKCSEAGIMGEKTATLTVRCGIDYANIQSVIEKEQSGQINCSGKLSGREWILFPYVLKSLSSGKLLFRFYTVEGQTAKSRYFIDGQEVANEALPTYCLSSEYKDRGDFLPCFDLPIENIVSVK